MFFNNRFDVIIRRIKHENSRYLLNTILKKMQTLGIMFLATGHKDVRTRDCIIVLIIFHRPIRAGDPLSRYADPHRDG